MLSNIKRKKIIGGLLTLSMIVSLTPGCGNNSNPNDKEKDKEDDSGHSSFIYPWWVGSSHSDTTTPKSSVTNSTNTTTSKVQSAGSGKTGIGSSSARSSAVS